MRTTLDPCPNFDVLGTKESRPLAGLPVNFHVTPRCNAACRFCFATFKDGPDHLPLQDARRVVDCLRSAGAEKITFAGGEPTLLPYLGELLDYAKSIGFVTGVVTNGARLDALLDAYGHAIDWVALSIDSGDDAVQTALGRGRGRHVARAILLARRCHAMGIRVKMNTVVTALTWQEDMSEVVRAVRPERWKVFQVLRVVGQNDGRVELLLITPQQFEAFVRRHRHLMGDGICLVPEDNEAMIDSYVMVDPMGRFFGNTDGIHKTSRPIVEAGVEEALREIGFDPMKLDSRGGRYDWGSVERRSAA
jgi:radical S-adenosyl methionine domain-containing protein 2